MIPFKKTQKIFSFFLFIGFVLILTQAIGQKAKGKSITEDRRSALTQGHPVSPFSNSTVKLKSSWLEQREKLNRAYLHQLNPDRLLVNFRVNAGIQTDAKPLEGWESPQCGLRGHFVGHYLSACRFCFLQDLGMG